MPPDELTIEALRRWSHVLLWISIVLPSLGALAAGARYYVERYERRLSGQATAAAIQQAQQESTAARVDATSAKETQATLGDELARSREELAALREKTAPRRLAERQRTAMRGSLERLQGKRIAVACRMLDGESCDYALDIVTALREAGSAVPDLIKTSMNDFPGEVVVCARGNADETLVRTVADVLRRAGVPAATKPVAENSVGIWYPDMVHVVVGRRAP